MGNYLLISLSKNETSQIFPKQSLHARAEISS